MRRVGALFLANAYKMPMRDGSKAKSVKSAKNSNRWHDMIRFAPNTHSKRSREEKKKNCARCFVTEFVVRSPCMGSR